MKKFKKSVLMFLVAITLLTSLAGCNVNQADIVSNNVSDEADNFNVIRRLTVLNARSDMPMFELVGAFSITVDGADNQLEVVVETGEGEYKKHFVALNEWTMYVVEDIGGASVSKYHYEVNFLPKAIVPITFKSKD